MSNDREHDVLRRWRESIEHAAESLLVNFETIGDADCALVAANASAEFKDRIVAAVLSHKLGIKSIDHVRKTYLGGEPSRERNRIADVQAAIYRAALDWIEQAFARLDSHRAKATAGEFRACVALERLRSSFFAALMLYRLGRFVEAHAVSRFILEQIAWAYEVSGHDDVTKIRQVKPGKKTFTRLKRIIPRAGKLYGALSQYGHLSYDLHDEVLTQESDRASLIIADYAGAVRGELVLTHLADICAMVYEFTQHRFIKEFVTGQRDGEKWIPRPDRSIVRTHEMLVEKARRAAQSVGAA